MDSPEVRAVKVAIAALKPSERAFLRPWLLAKFDVSGNLQAKLGDDLQAP